MKGGLTRYLTGGLFQFDPHYEIAGYTVYMGEVILALAATVIAALVCLRRRLAVWVQIVMAFLLLANAFDDVRRSLQAGMTAHLSKPAEPNRLFETLERLARG